MLEDVEVDGAEFLVDFFFCLGEVGKPFEEFCGLFFDLVGAASDDILPDVGGVFEVVLGEHLLPGFDLGGFGVEDESVEVEEEGFDQGVRVPLRCCVVGRMGVQPTLLVRLPVAYELGFMVYAFVMVMSPFVSPPPSPRALIRSSTFAPFGKFLRLNFHRLSTFTEPVLP